MECLDFLPRAAREPTDGSGAIFVLAKILGVAKIYFARRIDNSRADAYFPVVVGTVPMPQTEVIRLLEAGRALIAPALEAHGFAWVPGRAGKGSGGFCDSGEYVRGDRRLELHFRWSLGLVRYHVGPVTLSHEDYMRHTGHRSDAKYPGFSTDPLDAFRGLAHDLEHFCGDFISGTGASVLTAKNAADDRAKLTGFQKLGEV